MASECISIEPHGPATVLRFNRPPANAIELGVTAEFEAALDAVMEQDAAAIVLTGNEHFFSGGLDLKIVPTYSPEEQRTFLDRLNRLMAKLYACPLPVVGAINGHAIAGGFMLALTTDYRIGPTGTARFGLTEAQVGIPFPGVTLIVLQAELAAPSLRYAMLYGRHFGSEEAQARGVLDELQPPEAVLDRAVEVAREMASMPADGYRRIKHQLRATALERIEKLLASGADPMLQSWLSPQAQEAAAALLRESSRQATDDRGS